MDIDRIQYLRGELDAERIGTAELAEIDAAFAEVPDHVLDEPRENAMASDMLDVLESVACPIRTFSIMFTPIFHVDATTSGDIVGVSAGWEESATEIQTPSTCSTYESWDPYNVSEDDPKMLAYQAACKHAEGREAAVLAALRGDEAPSRPVVLIYIDGDSYGADAEAWPGTGDPIVVTFDGSRYDKYNRDPCEHDDEGPREDYAEDLALLVGHPAHESLSQWVEDAAESMGLNDNDDENED